MDPDWLIRVARTIARRLNRPSWVDTEDVVQEAVLRVLASERRGYLPADPEEAERYAFRTMARAASVFVACEWRRGRVWPKGPKGPEIRTESLRGEQEDRRDQPLHWPPEFWGGLLAGLSDQERTAVVAMVEGGSKRRNGNAAKALGMASQQGYAIAARGLGKVRLNLRRLEVA